MSDDLKKARQSLNDGRVDEALLYLWNGLESARLEGGRALRELEQLAVAAGRRGDESQKAESQRLLDSLRGLPPDAGAEAEAEAQAEVIDRVPVPDAAPAEEQADGPIETQPEAEPEPETPARRNLGRYAIPAIFLLIVLVNLLARAFGD